MAYFLGIDIGGTKSHALIADEEGRAVGFGQAGPVFNCYRNRTVQNDKQAGTGVALFDNYIAFVVITGGNKFAEHFKMFLLERGQYRHFF